MMMRMVTLQLPANSLTIPSTWRLKLYLWMLQHYWNEYKNVISNRHVYTINSRVNHDTCVDIRLYSKSSKIRHHLIGVHHANVRQHRCHCMVVSIFSVTTCKFARLCQVFPLGDHPDWHEWQQTSLLSVNHWATATASLLQPECTSFAKSQTVHLQNATMQRHLKCAACSDSAALNLALLSVWSSETAKKTYRQCSH